jgi:hypothetical protein
MKVSLVRKLFKKKVEVPTLKMQAGRILKKIEKKLRRKNEL